MQEKKTMHILLVIAGLMVVFLILYNSFLIPDVPASVLSYNAVTESSSADSSYVGGLVNINTASVEQLCTVPGIGEKTAQKIVSYREVNGKFSSLEQLDNVDGIGEKKIAGWRDYLTV